LIGGSNTGSGTTSNELQGDAYAMFDSAQGGNDTLTGGNASSGVVSNSLIGDAAFVTGDTVQMGDDILIAGTQSGSGSVTNFMYGDAFDISGSPVRGSDIFVFNGNVGDQNYVVDFQQDVDHIDINGLSIDDLTITTGVDPTFDVESTFITDGTNMVSLVGFTGTLTQHDLVALA
jgi:hypothetical protein